jgi:hypothetical protein
MVPCSPAATFNFIVQEPVGQWECTFANHIETVDEHTDIIHVGLMPVVVMGWYLKPRDLCLMRFWYVCIFIYML